MTRSRNPPAARKAARATPTEHEVVANRTYAELAIGERGRGKAKPRHYRQRAAGSEPLHAISSLAVAVPSVTAPRAAINFISGTMFHV